MEMHQIRYFLAVAETLNFTRAAEECHVAQPSLSRAVRKLEEELGGDLFRRERGQTHLTELGRAMLPLLRQAFDCASTAKAQAASYGAAEYAPLRLGLSQSVALAFVAPLLAELEGAYPGLALHLTRGEAAAVLEALKAGEIELALVADDAAGWERFDRWELFEESFVVLAAPGHVLAGQSSIKAAALGGCKLIARPYCESAPAAWAALAARGITLDTGHSAASDGDVRCLARLGLGLGLLPRSAADEDAMDLVEPGIKRTLYAYAVAGRRRSSATATLLALLRAADWGAD